MQSMIISMWQRPGYVGYVYYLGMEETYDCDYHDTSDDSDKSASADDQNGSTSGGRKSK